MTSPNQTTPGEVRLAEGQSKNSFHANDTPTPPWPSSLFDVLDRLDRNLGAVLLLIRGAN